MSMQQGVNNIKELQEVIEVLAKDMLMKCDNSVREINIYLHKEDDSFIITSD